MQRAPTASHIVLFVSFAISWGENTVHPFCAEIKNRAARGRPAVYMRFRADEASPDRSVAGELPYVTQALFNHCLAHVVVIVIQALFDEDRGTAVEIDACRVYDG